MPVQAQPQPEAELKGGVAQQSMKPVQEAAKSEDQKLRERLTADMARLEAAAKGDRFWAAQRLMCECISVIMDKAGTSIPSPDGPHKLPQESDSFVFLTNGRIYKFRRGEFPEYDAMMKVWNSPNSGGPKSLEDLQSLGMAGSDQQNFELDVETIEQTKIRCQEVLALLGGAR